MPAGLTPGVSGGTPRRIPELDGIRGIAILLIIVVHFGDYTQTSQSVVEKTIRALIGLGWTGVDLFFVLSGCLITTILLETKPSPDYFPTFYIRRALRILPLYYSAVAIFFFVALPLAHLWHRGLNIHGSEQSWFWFYLANWRIGFDEYAVEPLSHFWSLAIEEQFYLVWPVVVLLVSETKLALVCVGTILGAMLLRNMDWALALHAQYSEILYSLTPFRVDALSFGALIAVIMRSEKLKAGTRRFVGWMFLAGIAGTIAVAATARSVRPYSSPMGRFGYSAVDLSFACLILWALLKSGSPEPLPRALRAASLRRFGKYSYAMYVIHWPISLYLTDFFQSRFQSLGSLGAAFLCIAVGLGISYGLALVSWHVLEEPFLRMHNRFPYRASIASALTRLS